MKTMPKKNMILALILSFIWPGLGLMYAEDVKNGIALAVLNVIISWIAHYKYSIFNLVVFAIWVYSLYATYKQVKAENGE